MARPNLAIPGSLGRVVSETLTRMNSTLTYGDPRIVEAGTYLNGPQYILPDWGTASFLGAHACYDDGECAVAGDGAADHGLMAAILWNDTSTLYTRSRAKGDHVSVKYVEEPFKG